MKLTSLTIVVTAAMMTNPPLAAARPHKRAAPPPQPVAIADARQTATARVPGEVRSEELEREDGRWIYSFVIAPTAGRVGWVKEVNVDARSGKVVAVENERDRTKHR